MGPCASKPEGQPEGPAPPARSKSRGGASRALLSSGGASGSTAGSGQSLTAAERAARLPAGTAPKAVRLTPDEVVLGYKRDFHSSFEVNRLLGKGAFASVYQISAKKGELQGRKDLAVKVVQKTSLRNLQEALWMDQEVRLMKRLSGSLNVVHVYETFESGNHVYIVMELCSGGNLYEKMVSGGLYDEKRVALLMGDILRVAEQCHANGVIHRDIKPENFLFSSKLPGSPLKITDFGLADLCAPGQQLREISGTPAYIAPEVIRQKYSLPADVWSCGVVLYVLLTGKTPFHRREDGKTPYKVVFRRVLEEAVDFESDPWPSVSPGAKELCMRLLDKDPGKRPTAAEALAHPWLQETTEQGTAALQDSMVQRLQLFGSHNALKQHALHLIAQRLARPEVAELARLWREMNFDDVEALNSVRMLDALEVAGYTVGEREGSILLKRLLVGGQKGLTFEIFVAAVLDWSEMRRHEERWGACVHSAFEALDLDRDGFLSQEDLRAALGAPEDALARALRDVDANGDGFVDMAEFTEMMKEKGREVEMYDKRLSARFRNSFPRRTNSFLNRLQEASQEARGGGEGSPASEQPGAAPDDLESPSASAQTATVNSAF